MPCGQLQVSTTVRSLQPAGLGYEGLHEGRKKGSREGEYGGSGEAAGATAANPQKKPRQRLERGDGGKI